MNTLFAFMGIGPMEMVVVGVVAVLLFGKRLPEVARSMGKSMMEFKKGMSGLEDEFHSAANSNSRPAQMSRYNEIDDRDEATAPKFEPPAAEPKAESTAEPHSTG
jgi:sec-independent protein translocase protein TatA